MRISRKVARVCKRCGSEFLVYPSQLYHNAALYCNRECMRGTPAERFREKTTITDGCWLWTGAHDSDGYGHVRLYGEVMGAHRAAWYFAAGVMPDDTLDVGHTCDTPNCVRNDDRGVYVVGGKTLPRWGHLFLGTQADNMADMMAKGRHPCPSGMNNGTHTHPERVVRGERHGSAKLTDSEVAEMRRLAALGPCNKAALARQFQTSRSNVCGILAGRTRCG